MSSMGVIGEMRAAPRGDFSGWLADILSGAKGWLNQAQVPRGVPLVGGMGDGDMTMGQAPELMDSMSYGFSPVRGAGMAATMDPAVMDLLGLMAPAAGRADRDRYHELIERARFISRVPEATLEDYSKLRAIWRDCIARYNA